MIKPIKVESRRKISIDKIKISYALVTIALCHVLYFLLAGNNEGAYQIIIYSFLLFYTIEIAGNFRKWKIFDKRKEVGDQVHEWLEAFGNARATQQHIVTSYNLISRKIASNKGFNKKEVDSLLELCRTTIIYLESDTFPDLPVVNFAKVEIEQVQAYLQMIEIDIYSHKQLN